MPHPDKTIKDMKSLSPYSEEGTDTLEKCIYSIIRSFTRTIMNLERLEPVFFLKS